MHGPVRICAAADNGADDDDVVDVAVVDRDV